MAQSLGMTRTICLHGPESTGKTTLAPRLAAHYGGVIVPEFGRVWCEAYGIDLKPSDLLCIAKGHQALTMAAAKRGLPWLFLDTDPLMTAVWSDMLFGTRDPWFAGFNATADLYLLLDIDLPWIDDGTRMFGGEEDRRRFYELSEAELDRRGVRWARIAGETPNARFLEALEAIEAAGLG